MKVEDKIFVAGHKGLVGSAIVRSLIDKGYKNLLLKSRSDLDLLDVNQVNNFFESEKPDYVFLAAAKVGGILANNDFPADFIRENLMIQNNIIHAAYKNSVKKLLFLGSTCIYPKHAPQPMKENYLLSGELEPTNEAYAIAKIAGIKMCEAYNKQYGTNFISAMPTNLFGPKDNYDLESSHVLPALLRKFHEAKVNNTSEIEVWGTGNPRREFLYSDDLADAVIFLMNTYNESDFVNIGTGIDISIKDLAEKIKEVVGYKGAIKFNSSKPDGTPRKLVDVSKLNNLGWQATTSLDTGIKLAYLWYLENTAKKEMITK